MKHADYLAFIAQNTPPSLPTYPPQASKAAGSKRAQRPEPVEPKKFLPIARSLAMRPRKTMEQLLARYVVDPASGCWEWTGTKTKYGYGLVCIGAGGKATTRGAHRMQWERHNGAIPEDQHVLHRCDNRSCINPEHLFLGTHADNMHDMMAKGRQNFSGLRNYLG